MESFQKKCQLLLAKIKEYQYICIFRHQRPDPDALGAVFGLKEIILTAFPTKKVYVLGEKFPLLEKLFPYPDKLPKKIIKKALGIICDTANRLRIDDKEWQNCAYIVKIDHHPIIENYANLDVVFPKKPATCQIVAEFALEMNLSITKKAANYLFTGLVTDTGRFMYPTTSPKTLEIGAKLIKNGANFINIYDQLYTKTLKDAQFQAFIINHFTMKQGVAWIYLKINDLMTFDYSFDQAKMQVNTMAYFAGVNIWVLAIENEDEIKISMRSKPYYFIHHVASQFNGGGHKNACGAKVFSEIELQKLILTLQKVAAVKKLY